MFYVFSLLYMRDGLFTVMYALAFKDELLIEWQAAGIAEAVSEKEDVMKYLEAEVANYKDVDYKAVGTISEKESISNPRPRLNIKI